MSLFFVIAVLVAVLVVAELTRSTDGRGRLTSGSSGAAESSSNSRLTIGAWNIHRGRDASGVGRFDAMPAVLDSVDIAALQEVGGGGWGEGHNQARLIAETLGERDWWFASTRLHWFKPKGGNALVSRIQLNNVTEVLLESARRDYRSYLTAQLQLGRETVRIFAVHLSRDSYRDGQLAHVVAQFLAERRALLIGDFNVLAADPAMQDLLNQDDVVDAIRVVEARTASRMRRAEDVDWILVRGLDVIDARVDHTGLSDHPLWHATLELVQVK